MSSRRHQRLPVARSKVAKSPSPEQWLLLKPRITYLYREVDMNLKEVMELMSLEYEFHAT